MSRIDDGGMAFPSMKSIYHPDGMWVNIDEYGMRDTGMSLLAYFAAHENTEPEDFLTADDAAEYIGILPKDYAAFIHYPRVLAKWRFECAKAMVAELRRLESEANDGKC